ncbi:YebC/PmpR family DNA-binding transcriptional regulator [bacterium]|nr:MAG: YebC/PmpR family DNA-binding transcriptional regulator [bacterium]
MSGHSKWHSIKHKKGAADAKRGKIFTKLGNEIALAARDGADPDMNFRLRLAVQKAKQANMPASNIDRSIARGAGTAGGASLEELVYEGYGPAGVAVMVEALTDNRNRTASDVKSTFSKYGGNLGSTGSVAYMFDKKGVILCRVSADKDDMSLMAIEAGATDIDDSGDQLVVYTTPKDLEVVKEALGETNVESADIELVPNQTVRVEDEGKARSIMKLISFLDDLDDVSSVTANFDISDDLLERVSV